MLDFRMETFLTASRLLSYTETARELHITQPAVSQHIHFLEEHYNAKLFQYEGKKLCLTEAGVFLRKAATTMKHDEITLLETLKASPRRKLVFGATRTIGDYFIPETLIPYLARERNTDICMAACVVKICPASSAIGYGTLIFGGFTPAISAISL